MQILGFAKSDLPSHSDGTRCLRKSSFRWHTIPGGKLRLSFLTPKSSKECSSFTVGQHKALGQILDKSLMSLRWDTVSVAAREKITGLWPILHCAFFMAVQCHSHNGEMQWHTGMLSSSVAFVLWALCLQSMLNRSLSGSAACRIAVWQYPWQAVTMPSTDADWALPASHP